VQAGETRMPAWAGQGNYGVRFQWGPVAAPALSEGVCVVVDVLRFTTAVEAAVSRGVAVYPYRWRDATAATFADSVRARLADGRDPAGPSLSPSSMDALTPGTSLVLPSPNGSTCAVLASGAGAGWWQGACGMRRRWAPGRPGRQDRSPSSPAARGGPTDPCARHWRTCLEPGRSSPRWRGTRRLKRGRRSPPYAMRRLACPRSCQSAPLAASSARRAGQQTLVTRPG
jgi:hypothetical protein